MVSANFMTFKASVKKLLKKQQIGSNFLIYIFLA